MSKATVLPGMAVANSRNRIFAAAVVNLCALVVVGESVTIQHHPWSVATIVVVASPSTRSHDRQQTASLPENNTQRVLGRE